MASFVRLGAILALPVQPVSNTLPLWKTHFFQNVFQWSNVCFLRRRFSQSMGNRAVNLFGERVSRFGLLFLFLLDLNLSL